MFNDLLESTTHQIAIFLMEVTHRALETGFGGHHVPHVAAMHFRDGQHQRMEGRHIAAHDGL